MTEGVKVKPGCDGCVWLRQGLYPQRCEICSRGYVDYYKGADE